MSRRRKTPKKKHLSGFKPTKLVGRSPKQKKYIKAVKNNTITFVHGPAGSGKTHVAAALAVQSMRRLKTSIQICRPVVGVGRDIGYLPGTMEDKVGPYLMPLFDELCHYMERKKLTELLHEGAIEIVPLSMMRGRTFNDAFVILDEAQNATMPELRMLLTRTGANAKLVLAGDLHQSDLPPSKQGAFKVATQALDGIEGIAICALSADDIVRNPLIADIEYFLPKVD